MVAHVSAWLSDHEISSNAYFTMHANCFMLCVMESEELIARIVQLDPRVDTTMDIYFASPEPLDNSDVYLVTGTVRNVSEYHRYMLLLLIPAKASSWPDASQNGGVQFMDQERQLQHIEVNQETGIFTFVGRPSDNSEYPMFHLRPVPPEQDPFPEESA